MTTVVKKDRSVRISLDPRRLNDASKRCQHKIPTLEEIQPIFAGAQFFSKLDAKAGYWSVQIAEECQAFALQTTLSLSEKQRRNTTRIFTCSWRHQNRKASCSTAPSVLSRRKLSATLDPCRQGLEFSQIQAKLKLSTQCLHTRTRTMFRDA